MKLKEIPNVKKRIFIGFKIFIIFLIILLILFRTGIGFFQTSKSYIIWYFNNNKEDFKAIADYLTSFDNNLYFSRNIIDTKLYSDDNFSVVDKRISSKIIKTMQLGNYYNIDVIYSASNHDKINFVISNFTVRVGEPYGIIYAELEPSNWNDPDDYVLYYEKLCDNWYYCYRCENREYRA